MKEENSIEHYAPGFFGLLVGLSIVLDAIAIIGIIWQGGNWLKILLSSLVGGALFLLIGRFFLNLKNNDKNKPND